MKKWLSISSVIAVPAAIALNIIAVNFFLVISNSDIGRGIFSLITGLAPSYGFVAAVIAQRRYKEYKKVNILGMVISLIGFLIVITSMEFWDLPIAVFYIPILLTIPLTSLYLLGELIFKKIRNSRVSP